MVFLGLYITTSSKLKQRIKQLSEAIIEADSVFMNKLLCHSGLRFMPDGTITKGSVGMSKKFLKAYLTNEHSELLNEGA